MPHIAVKMYAGRSEAEKARLAEALAQALTATLGSTDRSISVGIEEIAPADWMETVYAPEITAKAPSLYKRPGYGPLVEEA